ncbi:MAG: nucleotidyltransferase domain-containing protein [Luteibacter sp.]
MEMALDVLFGGQRQRVLAWLLLHPDESAHVRELARLTGAHAGSLHRDLVRLADAGLITRSMRGNQAHYQATRACPIFDELASIFRKTTGVADLIRDAMRRVDDGIVAAFIFGSTARGTAHAGSDVDLFVVGSVAFIDLVNALQECQKALGREINPALYSNDELQRKLANGDAFLREVLAAPKLFVMGSEDDLGQPGSDRTTRLPLA